MTVAAGLIGLAVAFVLGRISGDQLPRAETAKSTPTFTQLTYLPGIETSPSLGPRAGAFAYEGDATGSADIYLQRVGPHNPINLTPDSPDDDTAPAISGDGQHIAFRSERLGGGIFVMGATGESVRRVTDFGFDPGWSPDGLEIVVSTEAVSNQLARTSTSELWVVRIADGERRRLSEGDAVQPDWSPSGGRIAFWATPPATGQRDIFTIPAGGGQATAVTDDAWVDWTPVWSPDGTHLYFSSDRAGTMNLYWVPIDEASGEVLGDPEPVMTPSSWSGNISFADTGQLVYATYEERSTLYRLPFDPRREQVGTPKPFLRGSRIIEYLHLSPDGQRVAFTSGGLREDLFIVGSDGEGYRQLTDDQFRDRGPQWSPDGSQIAFYSNRGGRYDVWSARTDGTLERLSQTTGASPWFPTWSPSGDRFAASNGEAVSIYDVGVPRSEREGAELPRMAGESRFMASSWSPDGRFLAGHSLRQGSPAEGAHVYSFESGEFSPLSDRGFHPVWLAGSERLLLWQARGLSLIDHRSRRMKELLPQALGGMRWRTFSVSADNRLIVFVETTRQGDIWLMTP